MGCELARPNSAIVNLYYTDALLGVIANSIAPPRVSWFGAVKSAGEELCLADHVRKIAL